MFSSELKRELAEQIQAILQDTQHPELPKGEIQFLLHVDGEAVWSWANIRNNGAAEMAVPSVLWRNMTAD